MCLVKDPVFAEATLNPKLLAMPSSLGCLTLSLALLTMVASAQALKFDYQIGNASDANQIVVSDGGYTATASGNPENSLDPTDPPASGAPSRGVNVGMALGFGRGIGCGTAIGITP